MNKKVSLLEHEMKNLDKLIKQHNPNLRGVSQRKLDGYMEYVKIIQWGRRNPTKFVEEFMGISFLDLQKYVFANMWVTPFVLLCQCRNSGKSTISAPFLMAKSVLYPNFYGYIISATGNQSQETFL